MLILAIPGNGTGRHGLKVKHIFDLIYKSFNSPSVRLIIFIGFSVLLSPIQLLKPSTSLLYKTDTKESVHDAMNQIIHVSWKFRGEKQNMKRRQRFKK